MAVIVFFNNLDTAKHVTDGLILSFILYRVWFCYEFVYLFRKINNLVCFFFKGVTQRYWFEITEAFNENLIIF